MDMPFEEYLKRLQLAIEGIESQFRYMNNRQAHLEKKVKNLETRNKNLRARLKDAR